jgi:hypothetical protein
LGGGAFGSRDADHSEPGGDTRGEPFDDMGGGRTGAEPNDHPVLDLLDCAQRCRAL